MTAARPTRRMPSRKAIADYWEIPADKCERCGHEGFVERAHLIDRYSGGLDLACNLALLCLNCHQKMPSFDPGDEALADAWIELTDEQWHANVQSAVVDLVEAEELDVVPVMTLAATIAASSQVRKKTKTQAKRDEAALLAAWQPVYLAARDRMKQRIDMDIDVTASMVRFVLLLSSVAIDVQERVA